MNTRIHALDGNPVELDLLDKEIFRLEICLAEKPSAAIKETLEREREVLLQERSLLLVGISATRQLNA